MASDAQQTGLLKITELRDLRKNFPAGGTKVFVPVIVAGGIFAFIISFLSVELALLVFAGGVIIGFFLGRVPVSPPMPDTMNELVTEAEDTVKALLEDVVGSPMRVVFADVEFADGFSRWRPTGLGWDGAQIHVVSEGRLATIPLSLVRSWSFSVQGADPVPWAAIGTAFDIARAKNQAHAQLARNEVNARKRSGFFIDVKDVMNPRWQFQTDDTMKLHRLNELMNQIFENRT